MLCVATEYRKEHSESKSPALATGNIIVLRPSEITPFTALKVAEFITEAGFPTWHGQQCQRLW
ncbi:hypothetical protein JOM56_015107 [Amanita muscaria]